MMEKIQLLVLVFSEILILSSCLPVRQYHFVSQLLNWTEAQTYCRQKYTDLATIETSDEMDQLMNTTLSAEYTPEFWVGLYSEIKWRWSDGFTGSITDNNYNNWASQDSSNALGGQICMIALWHDVDSTHPQHYHWNDTSCSSLYPFVCNTGTVQNPQYVFVNERLNWSSAQRYCRQNFTDLATARTSTNWQALSSVMPSYQNLWIGVYRDLNISWSDGTLPSFYPTTLNFYIRPSVVSARCGYHKWLNKNNWFFSTCERKYPFICHKEVPIHKRVVKLKLKTENSADLNDAAVKVKLLEELQKKLEENGVSGVEVKWKQQTDGKVFNKEKKKTEL